jgi:hypothetical protein
MEEGGMRKAKTDEDMCVMRKADSNRQAFLEKIPVPSLRE